MRCHFTTSARLIDDTKFWKKTHSKPIFLDAHCQAMSISRTEILRRKAETEVEKLRSIKVLESVSWGHLSYVQNPVFWNLISEIWCLKSEFSSTLARSFPAFWKFLIEENSDGQNLQNFYAILCNPWISSAMAMAMSIYRTLCVLVLTGPSL